MSITVKTRGMTQMKTFASAAQNIPEWAFPIVVEELRLIGIAAGKTSIKETTGGGKYGSLTTSGNLHDTFMGVTEKISKEHSRVEIGSPMDYAKFAAVDTGPVVQYENVQIIPHPIGRGGYVQGGLVVFIGIRPRIKGHPFMQAVKDEIGTQLDPIIARVLQQGWQNAGQKGKGAPPVP